MFDFLKYLPFTIAAAILTGCSQNQAPINHAEDFTPDNKPTETEMLYRAQMNRGALADGTLYSCHFDGQYLNSLGMAKLDAMVRAQSDPPVQVWLAVPDDNNLTARRMSVAAYLKDQGLSPEQIVLGNGPNPAIDFPASKGLIDLNKMEGDQPVPQGAGVPPTASPSSGATP